MALISGSVTILFHSKLHLNIQNHNRSRAVNNHVIRSVPNKIHRAKTQYLFPAGSRGKYVVCSATNQHPFSYNDDFVEEPFWLKLPKEAFGALKSLLTFLLEQPSQLQYIEWPSLESTLKTATLTLVLVALLIVTLASVDSALAFMLALFLRKPA